MERGIPSGVYKKDILELYRNPSNFGELKNFTSQATESNSICGDEITVQLLIKEGRIAHAKFSGSGCTLSMAAASLLTSKIKGMKEKDVKNFSKDDIKKLFKTKLNSSRTKCIMLPLEAIKKALK